MFYARRGGENLPRAKNRRPAMQKKTTESLSGLLESVQALGLTTTTLADVSRAVKELFSNGWNSVPEAEVIRSVFIHLKPRIRLIICHDKWHYQVS